MRCTSKEGIVMLARRIAILMIAAAGFLVALPGLVRSASAQSSEQAIGFVTSTSDQLVAIVNGTDSSLEKRHRLQAVLASNVDVDGIARFCLGRYWQTATPEQQAEYIALFHDLLVDKIAGHLGDYKGVAVTVGLARAGADSQIVTTRVDRPGTDASRVDWVVGTINGSPQIVDLLAEGTSLRLTQASDFSGYLARNRSSVAALIVGMRQVVAQINQVVAQSK
jgi:phospholipid transport system substrate-binding protein